MLHAVISVIIVVVSACSLVVASQVVILSIELHVVVSVLNV